MYNQTSVTVRLTLTLCRLRRCSRANHLISPHRESFQELNAACRCTWREDDPQRSGGS